METADDHYTWTDEKLNDQLALHAENRIAIDYSGERLQQVSRSMAHIAFELSERERERRGYSIEEAWGGEPARAISK